MAYPQADVQTLKMSFEDFLKLENDRYRTIDLQDGIYKSKILTDFQFTESWLWQDPLPNVLDILKHLNIV